jgi:hypothetical protein
MKLSHYLIAALFTIMSAATNAQTAAGISDDDLRRYALTMDSVKVMQETLTQIITENVQKNTVMPVTRYNQLFKVAENTEQLKAANATPEEIAFLKEVADLRQYNISRINNAYQSLAKDYVGLKAFNSIKKSLETDENLKKRYEGISQEVQSSRQQTGTKGK